MRRLVLTSEEKRIVLFVVIAFLLGLAAKYYRDRHPRNPPPKHETAGFIASPASGESQT